MWQRVWSVKGSLIITYCLQIYCGTDLYQLIGVKKLKKKSIFDAVMTKA